jgi:hypothetical protein
MTNYQYLIIGGGMTAAAAVDGFREVDSAGIIGLSVAANTIPRWKGHEHDNKHRTTHQTRGIAGPRSPLPEGQGVASSEALRERSKARGAHDS